LVNCPFEEVAVTSYVEYALWGANF